MFLAQIPAKPQLPPLPEGPALERVRGPVEIPPYEPWQIALAVGFSLIFLGLLVWLYIRSRKKAKTSIPPYKAAICELDAAAQLTAEDDDRFAVLSSLALRRYLENSLGLQFSARTSDEFIRSLRGDTRFDDAFHGQLTAVLAAFDQIKFAGQPVRPEERIQLTDTVRRLIEQVEHTQADAEKGGTP